MNTAFLLLAVLTAPPQFVATTLDGRTTTGTLAEIGAQRVVLQTSDGESAFPINQLLGLVPVAPAKQQNGEPVSIELIDGSTLTAGQFTADKESATISSKDGAQQKISAGAVHAVRFLPLDGPSVAVWDEHLHNGAAGDLIAIRKKGTAAIDFLEGVIGPVTASEVAFQLDGETIPVKREKVAGIIYYRRAGQNLAAPVCVVQDASGGRFQAKQVSSRNGKLEVVAAAGPTFSLSLDQITRIDFSAGKITYLSDLVAESVQWLPFIGMSKLPSSFVEFHQPRRDHGREGPELLLGGKAYGKGLSLCSQTTMVYKLPAQSRQFQALAGIDDRVRGGGNVVLRISGDDKRLFESTITGKDQPLVLDLDVSGVKRLKIAVEFGGDTDVADHLNLCEAKVIK